jgi:hypothetical protein
MADAELGTKLACLHVKVEHQQPCAAHAFPQTNEGELLLLLS